MHRFAVLAFLIAVSLPALAKNGVTITFEETAVVARVTPGASTAWFSIAHEYDHTGLRMMNGSFIIADDDRDGVVRLPLNRPASATSFWMVVDMSTGEHAIESPGPSPVRRRHLPPSAIHAKGNGAKARVLQGDSLVTVFVARPGVGAWVGRVKDGSHDDGDGLLDGQATALFEKLTPVGNSPPAPDDFQRDDVVAFVEPLTLSIVDGRVVK
jgi:hypothetical protein